MNGATRSIPSYNQHTETQQLGRLAVQQYQQQQQGYPLVTTAQHHQHQSQHSDIFTAILDGDHRQQSGPGFEPIDWPVHAPAQGGRSEQGM
jgi:hypothetical protein